MKWPYLKCVECGHIEHAELMNRRVTIDGRTVYVCDRRVLCKLRRRIGAKLHRLP